MLTPMLTPKLSITVDPPYVFFFVELIEYWLRVCEQVNACTNFPGQGIFNIAHFFNTFHCRAYFFSVFTVVVINKNDVLGIAHIRWRP